jgi:hypothetical protein
VDDFQNFNKGYGELSSPQGGSQAGRCIDIATGGGI